MNWFKRLVRKLFPTDEEMHIAPTAPAPLMPRGRHGWQPVTPAEIEALKRKVTPDRPALERRADRFRYQGEQRGRMVCPAPPQNLPRRAAMSPAHAAPYGSRSADTSPLDHTDPYLSLVGASLLQGQQAAERDLEAWRPAEPAPSFDSGRGGGGGGD